MKLAINNGKPIRTKLFPPNITTDYKEIKEVKNVINSGILSNFLGAKHENFYGGKTETSHNN